MDGSSDDNRKRPHPASNANDVASSEVAAGDNKRVKLEDVGQAAAAVETQDVPQTQASVDAVASSIAPTTQPQPLTQEAVPAAVSSTTTTAVVSSSTQISAGEAAALTASKTATAKPAADGDLMPAALLTSSSSTQAVAPATQAQSVTPAVVQSTTQHVPAASTSAQPPAKKEVKPASTPSTTVVQPQRPQKQRAPSPPPPLKALTFHHLHKKYGPELDYMLVEFRKLERQLLGAPIHAAAAASAAPKAGGAAAAEVKPKVEPKGSRERREKLHGFILHLEDTIRQVEEGCAVERSERNLKCENNGSGGGNLKSEECAASHHQQQPKQQPFEEEKKSSDASLQPQPNTASAASSTATIISTPNNNTGEAPKFTAADASLSQLPPEKEREESVQRLEEHILANLLPVKIRLTRQLAAQKGATKNPITAPLRAGSVATAGVQKAGVSIAEAVEAKRKAQEERLLQQQLVQKSSVPVSKDIPSQFGKPIGHGSSSLTARLHGGVLGASGSGAAAASPANAASGAAASGAATPSKRRILYAGVAPGSTQVPSSVHAVSGVHPGMVGADAAKAVVVAEEERKRLKYLEESAARVAGVAPAGGGALDRKPAARPTAIEAAAPKPPEGPATMAARARAIALAAANNNTGPSAASKVSRPNQQIPGITAKQLQQQHLKKVSPLAAATAANQMAHLGMKPVKPKKPHLAPDFNDPALTATQQNELRLKEARWRQRKRRKERRRKRSGVVVDHAAMVTQHAQSMQEPNVHASSSNDAVPAQPMVLRVNKNGAYGPRTVEYVCAVCNEGYVSTCEMNPWWALMNHECPKCGKNQVSVFVHNVLVDIISISVIHLLTAL